MSPIFSFRRLVAITLFTGVFLCTCLLHSSASDPGISSISADHLQEVRDAGDPARSKQVKLLCRCLNHLQISKKHQQMVVVTSDHWSSSTGTMWLVERKHGHWLPTGNHWAINTGRNGMGWGRGLIENSQTLGALKHEGDGKTPAGIFELGTTFGYDAGPPAGSRMPYKQATDHDYFVDDVSSSDYNKWVTLDPELNKPHEHWQSFEEMRRQDDLYSLGIVVEHNMNPVVAGSGSAIFLHLWQEYGRGTSGCVSMSRENMSRLLSWLDPCKNALLFQLPCQDDAIEQLRRARVSPDS